jgi:NAD(P)-dependent dehydrogenase (short-subunit alcohol dehydrogenase family)
MASDKEHGQLCIDLKGKTALITGGSRGIGRAITLTLAAAGARVAAVFRTESESAQSLREELRALGPEGHLAFVADVTKPDDIARAMNDVKANFGSLDILVNNAGVNSRFMVEDLPDEEWQRLIDTNLSGVFRVTQAALKIMRASGSVVTISPAVAPIGQPGISHYTASKLGTIGFMRSVAKELGPKGIRVNVISAGVTETDRIRSQPPEVRERYAKMAALGRLAQPEDIANVVAFLASDLAGFITGSVLTVDGGA